MNVATEALERQLQVYRLLKQTAPRAQNPGTLSNEARPMATTLAIEHELLPHCQPVYWRRQTAEAVAVIAPTFDLQTITCARELVYCDMAFCWFEHPVLTVRARVEGDTFEPLGVNAITWWYVEAPNGVRGLGITAWGYGVEDLGSIVPLLWIRFDDGQQLAPEVAKFESSEAIKAIVQFVIAAGVFLRQRIAVADKAHPDRYARKRLAAANWPGHSLVDVILLRARESNRVEPSDESDREFRFRWLVRAHHRQQWYPSLGKHLPVLIGPYIKGPDDKPLKPRSTPILLVNR